MALQIFYLYTADGYRLIQTGYAIQPWPDSPAQQACMDEYGTDLASIHSPQDQIDIQNLCDSVGHLNWCWIGGYHVGNKDYDNCTYSWIDGTPFNESVLTRFNGFGSEYCTDNEYSCILPSTVLDTGLHECHGIGEEFFPICNEPPNLLCEYSSYWNSISGNWHWNWNSCAMTQSDVENWGKIWLGSVDGNIPYFNLINSVSDSFKIEVIFEIMNGSNAGIMFHVDSISPILDYGPNYFLGINPRPNLVIFGYHNQSWEAMVTANYNSDFNQIYKMVLTSKGSYYNVSINDTMIIQDFYDDRLISGSIGLRTFKANATYYSLKFLGSSDIPQGYESDNYILVDTNLDFAASESFCQSVYGTNLASTHNENENMEVLNLCTQYGSIWSNWIGLNDIDNETNRSQHGWKWTDDSPYDETVYHKWGAGEPNNILIGGEDCVELFVGNGGYWNDLPCSRTYPFICNKYNPTTSPTFDPTKDPTRDPTSVPTMNPTNDPTFDPSMDPTSNPTKNPTNVPTNMPSYPTSYPTSIPTPSPTMLPTSPPSTEDAAAAADVTLEPTSDQRLHENDGTKNENSGLNGIIIILVSVGAVLLICGIVGVLILLKKKRKRIHEANDTTTNMVTNIEMHGKHEQHIEDIHKDSSIDMNCSPSTRAESPLNSMDITNGGDTTKGFETSTGIIETQDQIMNQANREIMEDEDDSRDSQSMDELFDTQHETTKGPIEENSTAGHNITKEGI